eukprot:TRINITY_DN3562_c0_g1_i1.p1 TRINITY_DN3562_c0_g1~~TRINITY_DN3562_c0_g1_i1.p1  ORF type:complete len:606 (-),score=155.27 TRINITY_DN3562_c0_g1_i1:309-2126(-)
MRAWGGPDDAAAKANKKPRPTFDCSVLPTSRTGDNDEDLEVVCVKVAKKKKKEVEVVPSDDEGVDKDAKAGKKEKKGKKDKKAKKDKKQGKENKASTTEDSKVGHVTEAEKERLARFAAARKGRKLRLEKERKMAEVAKFKAREVACRRADDAARRQAARREAYARAAKLALADDSKKSIDTDAAKVESRQKTTGGPAPPEQQGQLVDDIMSLWTAIRERIGSSTKIDSNRVRAQAQADVKAQEDANVEAVDIERKMMEQKWWTEIEADMDGILHRCRNPEELETPGSDAIPKADVADPTKPALESTAVVGESEHVTRREQKATLPVATPKETEDVARARHVQAAPPMQVHRPRKAVPEAVRAPAKASPFAAFETFNAHAAYAQAHGRDYNSEDEEGDDEEDESSSTSGSDAENNEHFLPAALFALDDLLPQTPDCPEEGMPAEVAVAHFALYAIGAWRQSLESGDILEGMTHNAKLMAMFRNRGMLQQTVNAVKPMLRQLRRREVTSKVLGHLEKMVRYALDREYAASSAEYMLMTIGRKTWMQSAMQIQMQQNHGGSISKLIKRSVLEDFDKDPVMQAYMLAIRRLITFVQCIRPPDDPSKLA